MSLFPPHLKSSPARRRTGRDSFALVATLALLAVATLILVLFVTTTSSDRSASYTYSQSLKADQIARGGLHMIVGQLQAEMYKDAMPDTGTGGTGVPVFTNLTAKNILPQATVTNAALPSLVKMSTNGIPFFSGGVNAVTSYDTGQLQSTAISSTAPSINGRSVSTNIWNEVYMGQYPNAASTPNWVLISRAGPASTGTFGATANNTVNNPAVANTSYVLGRVAFAIYDEGGLLDVTTAGYPSGGTLTASQLAQIKGTLAGADLTQVGIDPVAFIKWRNAASAGSASSYLSFVTNFASTNGFEQVYPGDSTFLSRQDLIKAAQNGTAGLTTTALPNLTTFTRELNSPSWAPSLNGTAATKYSYASNANNLTSNPFSSSAGKQNPNPYVPLVRYTNGGTVTGYLAGGASYTYQVKAGDPVAQHRFPLDRLNWITPTGPANGISAAAIQACFGLIWGTAENLQSGGDGNWSGIKVWKYVGPSPASSETQVANSTSSPVETLSDVAKEATPREPNFFELLQAGILSGSLGQSLGGANAFQNLNNTAQTFSSVQLLRIGANILSQVQSTAYPINIESNQLGYSMVASGVANLPYLNVLKFVSGADNNTTGISNTSVTPMATYGLVSLWNPHQQSTTTPVTRPNVRLYIQGTIALGSGWASSYPAIPFTTATYGQTFVMPANTCIQLSNAPNAGVNGFLNPFAITVNDVDALNSPPQTGSGTTLGWTPNTTSLNPAPYVDKNFTYEALRLPNLSVTLDQTGSGIPGQSSGMPESTSLGQVHFGYYLGGPPSGSPATAAPIFQLILKYQDPNNSSNWVPYDYWTGNSNWQTWWTQFGLSGPTIAPPMTGSGAALTTHSASSSYPIATVDQTLHSTGPGTARYHSGTLLNPAPLAMRPGIFPMSGDHSGSTGTGDVVYPLIDSIWSGSANSGDFSVGGYGGAGSNGAPPGIPSELNSVPTDYVSWFFPAYLCRNNTPYPNVAGSSPGTYFTAYPDPDGIQRIADSGLFPTTTPVSAPAVIGNPYYDPNDVPNTAGQRTGDRPIVLNRPLASVGELGYVSRDDPWRSLDFFSTFKNGANYVSTSADSGLLDLFTVTDSPNSVIAGRINLNTKNPLALQAILSGTMADALGNTSSSTQISNPAAMANALVSYTSSTTAAQALVNKDQLVTKFNPSLPAGATYNSPFGSVDEQNVKFCREAFVRSLADVGQTRTWNLLIDIVAQAGKYPATATTLDQFNVEGERHYWLHVAIDRVTGKVIDQQLELVEP